MKCTIRLFALLLAVVPQVVIAIPVDCIESKQINPIAPRGGVLMVQLIAEQNGNLWPTELGVVFSGGVIRNGYVGWIEKNPNSFAWTSNPYVIRPIRDDDDTSNINLKDAVSGPVLLVELPIDGKGDILFGNSTLEPKWIDLPGTSLITKNDRSITQEQGDMVPEWNPLEYWRWEFVARRTNQTLPSPLFSSEVGRLAALHGLTLWQIGFDRLTSSNPEVASVCSELLSNTADDGHHSFACWIVQSESLHRLLSILLDMKASPRQLAQRASRWAKEQQPFIHWLERVYGEYVTLAVANPTSKVATSSIKWRDVNGLPETTKIDEHHVERIQVTRPILLDLAVFGPTTPDSQLQWLTLTLPNQQTNLPIVSGMVTVKPPSVQLETLYPLWNLGDVMMGIPSVVPQKNRTSIELRKMFGRWELFIRCNGLSGSGNLPKTIESITQLQGIESISILQPKNKSIATISPSQQNVPDGMEIYRTVQGSSWTVRAVLPQSWISNGILSFSAVRTHGDSPRVETAPLPCVPWNINPEPIILDLSEWDTVDRFPNPRH